MHILDTFVGTKNYPPVDSKYIEKLKRGSLNKVVAMIIETTASQHRLTFFTADIDGKPNDIQQLLVLE